MFALLKCFDMPDQSGNGWRLKEGQQLQFHLEGISDARDHLRCEQRMPTQSKEVIMNTNQLHT